MLTAPLLLGVVNRVKAKVAGRRGQPLLQPYFDLRQLLGKGAVYSDTSTWVFRASPPVGLAVLLCTLLIVPFGGITGAIAFPGDLFAFAALLALARFLMVLAALDTGSSFEGMGASREATFGALTEPALLLGLAAIARQVDSASLSAIIYPLWGGAAAAPVLVLGVLAVVFVVENARMPVDDPNTHLELTMIHEVMALDHSGPDLAFIHYTSALKLWALGALIVGLAVPQPAGWLGVALAVAGMIAVAVTTGLIESFVARLRMNAVPQFLLGGTALAAVALLLGLR